MFRLDPLRPPNSIAKAPFAVNDVGFVQSAFIAVFQATAVTVPYLTGHDMARFEKLGLHILDEPEIVAGYYDRRPSCAFRYR